MNAVEIADAVAALVAEPFERDEFPFAFLEAYGNKAVTIKRLRGKNNKSNVPGGVLQRNNVHLATCAPGEVEATREALLASPKTTNPRARIKFVLATDGQWLEAEDLTSGETLPIDYADLAEHFGFFLPLAGISTVREIKDNPVDVRATGRLNKLYVELLKRNPDWAERRHDMNHFMARLIFCFFAEDTDIFDGEGLFTRTLAQMSEADGSNLDEVLSTLFQAMDIKHEARNATDLPGWAKRFPYVNGSLFSGSTEVPHFSKSARSYILRAGDLDWKAINPDIFGSMIQAVADDDERGQLGMHYTSVPNILKVLNPLFLDDLRQQLEYAGDNARKLLNLRKRLARIRVFDPACGSGNFLVIAYKQMRAIEAAINERRGELQFKSAIPLTNFRGIELRDFAAEVARLALVIAEYQCDVRYRGQKEALKDVLPLSKDNWVTQGNALKLDWLSICPPTGSGVKMAADDLFETPLDQAEINFENEGGETYICGNPPYLGSQRQDDEQKEDMRKVFDGMTKSWKSLDYVAGWFMKAAEYGQNTTSAAAFVATNSVCQGRQVATLWPLIFETGHAITFAHTSFKWANLAAHNAGVTVVIVGISAQPAPERWLYSISGADDSMERTCTANINAYLAAGENVVVFSRSSPLSGVCEMSFGNMPNDGGNLLLSATEATNAIRYHAVPQGFIRPFLGSQEFIRGLERRCIWVNDNDYKQAAENDWLRGHFNATEAKRLESSRGTTKLLAQTPYRFGEVRQYGNEIATIVPRHASELRQYFPVSICRKGTIVADSTMALYDAPLWNMALIASKLHLVWIATVCGKLETRYRYSNTLGWNTFPVPTLTEQMKADLTRAAENILLAREAHFPATIADLYKPGAMPEDLARAHQRNDEIIERIYIGRRFKNDTERLEKLFELYTQMSTGASGTRHVN